MSHHQHHEGGSHHIVPLSIYRNVFLSLIALTVITVATSYIDFGGHWNILIAMVIATVKAMLVTLFFMGLRYDGYENNVTFFCSFAFLAIFVGLTSADLFYRIDSPPVRVDSSDLQQSTEPVDMAAFYKPSPELLAKGNTLFTQQCATCHGATGRGDGPASGALNPKPRNFTSTENWKKGRTVSQVFRTVTDGLQGTPMPSFSALSVEERFAVVHHVRSLMPDQPDEGAEALAALQKDFGGGAKPRITVDQAMEIMDREAQQQH